MLFSRYGWKVWCMATPSGELLACQPYAGAKTHIPDVGLGQGPNVVFGLATQFGLSPGSKIACDNLFTSFDLLDNMAEKGLGVIGTVRQNRIIGVPVPAKKEAVKVMVRGDLKTVYDDLNCLTVWRDSQPVYMASNFSGPDTVGTCQRFGGSGKGYISVPCPNNVLDYNRTMGGVDLLNQSHKVYRISVRLKKWYWSLYTWFLSVQMVQAWRLFRATMKSRHALALEQQVVADLQFEQRLDGLPRVQKEALRKERDDEMKRKRRDEKKKENIKLLPFLRETVEVILDRHGDKEFTRELPARLSASSAEAVRHDHGRAHLIIKTTIQGRCKQCNKRSYYRIVDLPLKFQ